MIKKRVLKCSSCDFTTSGPAILGKHYKETGHEKKRFEPKSQLKVVAPAGGTLEDMIARRDQLKSELNSLNDSIEQRIAAMGLKWDPNASLELAHDAVLGRNIA